jgi:hypothetical protein
MRTSPRATSGAALCGAHTNPAHIAATAAHIDKPAFKRPDMVEFVGAQLPADAPGDPRALIERIVDEVSVRITATREAHHRRRAREVHRHRDHRRRVDEAMQKDAGGRGLTVAEALKLIENNELNIDRSTVVVVDEASMVGTREPETAVLRDPAEATR